MDKTKESLTEQSFEKKIFFYTSLLLFIIYIVLLIKTAWIGDDAYITFRTIDNFINGYGLRWNIAERVQSYTHPLWLFVLSFIYFFTHEIFFSSLILSIIISIITILILLFVLSIRLENKLLILFALIFSKAYTDYSTSGLENPLTNLLLVLYLLIYFKKNITEKNVFLLSLLSGLILMNRMDCILLILPSLAFYLFKYRKQANYLNVFLGFLPFLLWELFSLWYYGFLFPNTAYAKLNTGINKFDLMYQGLVYYYSSFKLDPLTITVIFTSLIIVVVNKDRKHLPFALGIGFYLIYIISIGGDFMAGRFFSSPFLISLIILGGLTIKNTRGFLFLFSLIIIVGALNIENLFIKNYGITDKNGISDERLFYYKSSNLIYGIKDLNVPNFPTWVEDGKRAREENLEFVSLYSIGFFGFYAGPNCFVLDKLALTDPFLARLPTTKNWRIGHFFRKIPDGYEETLKTGRNQIKDTNLAKYYDKIFLITRGNLFDWGRVKEIWKINTGQYSYLIRGYLNH